MSSPRGTHEPTHPHVVDVHFVTGVTSSTTLPAGDAPEIALAGRSNVGKSSLLGRLVGRRGLVRVSNTPGRTREINLFRVTLEDGQVLTFADLPGYGYARVPKVMRARWGPLIEGYLKYRAALRAVVLIVDARRGVEPDDRALVDYLASLALPVLLVATKIDKLPKNLRKPRAQAIAKALGVRVVQFSATTGEGCDQLWRSVQEAARES